MGMTISFHISLVFFSFFIASSCKIASLSRGRLIDILGYISTSMHYACKTAYYYKINVGINKPFKQV